MLSLSFAGLVLQALIDEDRLLSRLEVLENQLLIYSKVCVPNSSLYYDL